MARVFLGIAIAALAGFAAGWVAGVHDVKTHTIVRTLGDGDFWHGAYFGECQEWNFPKYDPPVSYQVCATDRRAKP